MRRLFEVLVLLALAGLILGRTRGVLEVREDALYEDGRPIPGPAAVLDRFGPPGRVLRLPHEGSVLEVWRYPDRRLTVFQVGSLQRVEAAYTLGDFNPKELLDKGVVDADPASARAYVI